MHFIAFLGSSKRCFIPTRGKWKHSRVTNAKRDFGLAMQALTLQKNVVWSWRNLDRSLSYGFASAHPRSRASCRTCSFCWNLRKHTMNSLGGAPGLTGISERCARSKSSPPLKSAWRMSGRVIFRKDMASISSTCSGKPQIRIFSRLPWSSFSFSLALSFSTSEARARGESRRCLSASSSMSKRTSTLGTLDRMPASFSWITETAFRVSDTSLQMSAKCLAWSFRSFVLSSDS